MRSIIRAALALVAIAALFAISAGAAAAHGGRRDDHRGPSHPFHQHHHQGPPPGHHPGPPPPPPPPPYRSNHPVFVQTDNTTGNQVIAYDQGRDGSLTEVGAYATGGLGGQLEGSVVDHLASQGSLTYDAEDGLLYAVNAGSDTVSVFAVSGDRLSLRQVIGSGGAFPVSVAVSHGLVYVLNAEEGGTLQGYGVAFGRLFPIPGSSRALGLNPTETPQFTHTPGQVAFSPDGSKVIVTTKGNGSDIDVFGVQAFGRLSSTPVVNSEPGTVPFAVTFDQAGDLLVSQAGTNSVTSYALHHDGTVTPLSTVATGEEATCWVVRSGSVVYVSNAGSAALSNVGIGAGGQLSLLGTTETSGGTVDAAVAANGRFLYVQGGAAGTVDEFTIGSQGALTKVGTVTVPAAVGGEGIVAL
ncbi:MAG TPA: beta-propeller fold lactonase family protein [Solirubrobacterales bacterium]|nr:beta-propeller fold lactonase family protein [Solirubrobacterales bacterium]